MATLFGYSDPATQAWMILDAVRTDAYAEAIAATVGPDDVVLDIGSGSGVLALLAAKAGAKKVYALEMGSAKHLLRAHVQENGWADVIEIVEGNLRDAPPMDPKPTVILAEMLGHFAPQERMHALYAIARAWRTPSSGRSSRRASRHCTGRSRSTRRPATPPCRCSAISCA